MGWLPTRYVGVKEGGFKNLREMGSLLGWAGLGIRGGGGVQPPTLHPRTGAYSSGRFATKAEQVCQLMLPGVRTGAGEVQAKHPPTRTLVQHVPTEPGVVRCCAPAWHSRRWKLTYHICMFLW